MAQPLILPTKQLILGLDTSQPGEYVDLAGATSDHNMEVNRSIIRKRMGSAAFGSALTERIMAYAELQIGVNYYPLRFGLTKVELWDGVAWTDVTGTPLGGTNESLFDFAFPVLSGVKIMAFTNGFDPIRKYTGTGNTAALGGSPPIAKFMITYSDYLIIANILDGVNDFPFRVQWPDTGDPETWSGDNNSGHQDLIEDGQPVSGLGLFGPYFTVHKLNSIIVGLGVDSSEVFRFTRLNTGIGAVAHQTIRNIPTGEQIFLAMDGLHLFNGNTAPLIPSKIMDEIRESINPQHANKSCSVVVRELDEVWFGVPIGSQIRPETIYKYNYRTGACWRDDRAGMTAIGFYTKTNQVTWDNAVGTWDEQTVPWDYVIFEALNPTILFGYSDGNSTERSTATDDAGEAIDAQWDSKDFTAEDLNGNMGQIVRWTAIQVWAKGHTMKAWYSIDGGSTWILIKTFTLDPDDYPSDESPAYGYFDVASTRCRFRFSNSVIAETFSFKKFFVEALLREMRR